MPIHAKNYNPSRFSKTHNPSASDHSKNSGPNPVLYGHTTADKLSKKDNPTLHGPTTAEKLSQNDNPILRGPTTAERLSQNEKTVLNGSSTADAISSQQPLSLYAGTTADKPGCNVHLTDFETQRIASNILDVGDKFLRDDDDDARLEYYASIVSKLDDDSAGRLYAEVLRQDQQAFSNWLTVDRAGDLLENNRISETERTALANGFITAYNEDNISQQEAEEFLNFWDVTQIAPASDIDHYQKPLDFLDSADLEDASNQFRQEFSTNIIEQRLNDENRFGTQEFAYATTILDGSTNETAVAELYDNLSAEHRREYLRGLSESGIGYVNSNERDPFSALLESVASGDENDNYEDHAVDIVRFADSARDDMFDNRNKPIDQRAEALGALYERYDKAINIQLANSNINTVPGSTNGETYSYQNAEALANLWRLTALNDENSHQEENLASINVFASDMKDRVNDETTDADLLRKYGELPDEIDKPLSYAIGALKMLGISAKESIDQAYDDMRLTDEMNRAMLNFVVQIGFAAIPGGGITGASAKGISQLFSNSKSVQNALESISAPIIKQGTNQLTDEAIEAIVDVLGEDAADIQDMNVIADTLINNAILRDVNELHFSDIESDIQNTAEDLRNR